MGVGVYVCVCVYGQVCLGLSGLYLGGGGGGTASF